MKIESIFATGLLIAFTVTVAGCAFPNRDNSNVFTVKQSGKIAKENVGLFTDCMLDGLNSYSGNVLSPMNIRQQTRSSLSRIDTLSIDGLMQKTSTDIFTNGDVQFLINTHTHMALVPMSNESNVFGKCLATYRLRK